MISEKIALCDSEIGNRRFNEERQDNDFEQSSVREMLNRWLKMKGRAD